ncbi:hypothetical protein TRP8649_00254 [Pelagimonas phthalicica]|uniref:Lipoprotein n=1 Tax=Pelagimonas phthalicica TaxID=1037362 RepID=A0A238J602_9RHOB|nr:hypothetical protein [Pelagimonas phthalicica]TDS95295.1 hypothetical protein CLV87_1818 [Pelagimonas phthalicica]SMX26181.1 hypothetical protein TRP8649_00254 [Pelagimonas phthalicica]
MKNLLFAVFAAVAIVGCVDPERAAERRAKLITAIFPSKSDQHGLHLVFPLESRGFYSTLQIVFFPELVSDQEIMRRANWYCSQYKDGTGAPRKAYVKEPFEESAATLADGRRRNARSVWITCLDPKK